MKKNKSNKIKHEESYSYSSNCSKTLDMLGKGNVNKHIWIKSIKKPCIMMKLYDANHHLLIIYCCNLPKQVWEIGDAHDINLPFSRDGCLETPDIMVEQYSQISWISSPRGDQGGRYPLNLLSL